MAAKANGFAEHLGHPDREVFEIKDAQGQNHLSASALANNGE
jgi:hypothetical protein